LCYYLTKTQIQFMKHTRYVWCSLLLTFFMFNLLHAQTRGEEIVEFEFDCPKIMHTVIGNILKDGAKMNDQRLDIGVGEEVELMIPTKFGVTNWEVIQGDGKLKNMNNANNTIVFEASLNSGKVVIRATPEIKCQDSPNPEITIAVFSPTLHYLHGCDLHTLAVCNSGMLLRHRLLPDNVSFHNIIIQEVDVKGVGKGTLFVLGGKSHIPAGVKNSWLGCKLPPPPSGIYQVFTNEGTDTETLDQAYMSLPCSFIDEAAAAPNPNGTLTFIIPALYAKHYDTSDSRYLPNTMVQSHELNPPNLTTSKGGHSYTANCTTPSTPTQLGDTECK
jgi:hypothetical protein